LLYSKMYMHHQVPLLIAEAKRRMAHSKDMYHNLKHVERVVSYATNIADSLELTSNQREGLLLAAWWHDAAHTLTRKPSFFLMPLIDDTVSALMLWYYTIRMGLFGEVAGLSTRLIFCKSVGTGLLSKIFLKKRNRILLDALIDADKLDMIDVGRTEDLYSLMESSRFYALWYSLMFWIMFPMKFLRQRTPAGRKLMRSKLHNVLQAIQQDSFDARHVLLFGERYTRHCTERICKEYRHVQQATRGDVYPHTH
jgi:hypothetical protein